MSAKDARIAALESALAGALKWLGPSSQYAWEQNRAQVEAWHAVLEGGVSEREGVTG